MKFPNKFVGDLVEFSFIYVAVFLAIVFFDRSAPILDKALIFIGCYFVFGAAYVAACAGWRRLSQHNG